jgi:hypothetical protein
VFAPGHVVALATGGFEAVPVGDRHPAAGVADQPGLLQHPGGQRHAGAAHAQHHGEELVRHGELVGPGAVVRDEQPAGEALLDGVARVAPGGQRHLRWKART